MSSPSSGSLFDARPICVIVAEDSRKILPSFRNSVDLIVTSPPYADSRKKHYESIHPDHFVEWFRTFHEPLWNALKPTGNLVINIKDKVVNSVRHRYVWHTIEMLSSLGWFCIDDYIWHKPNPMPGYWPTRLRDGWEYCFHLAKSPKPYINQNAIRKPIGDWVKARLSNPSENDLSRQNSVNKSGFGRNISRWADKKTVLPSNVISLALVGVNKGHPAVFPPELPEFFIKLLSPSNGLIADPFAGSGMTGLAAMNLGRDCVLIDNNKDYAKLAFRNLQEACVDDKFEIELRLADGQNICFPKQKVSPLFNLQKRHGLIKHSASRYNRHIQPAVG